MRGKHFTECTFVFFKCEAMWTVLTVKINILNFRMETQEENNFFKCDRANESYLKIIDLY